MKRSSPRVLGAILLVVLALVASSGDAATFQRDRVWSSQFGSDSVDSPLGVAVAGHGTYAAGVTYGQLPGQTAAGGSDAFVRRYTNTGQLRWTRQFGTGGSDYASGVAATSNGVAVAGAWGDDAYVRRYRSDGTIAWSRTFGTPQFDSANAVAVASDAVYVVGRTYGALPSDPASTNHGLGDVFVRKYTPTGDIAWSHQYGGAGEDNPAAVTVRGGSVYVAIWTDGTFPQGGGSHGTRDLVLMKLSTGGTRNWARQLGSPGEEFAFGVAADANHVYIAGQTFGAMPGNSALGNGDAVVAAYSPQGTQLWVRQFGTSGRDNVGALTIAPPGVVATGATAGSLPGQVSAGSDDAFLRGYTPAGTAVWTTQFGTNASDFGNGVAYGRFGVIVGGSTAGALFAPASLGLDDAFVARYARFRPDAKARFGSGSITGNNVYSPTGQVVPGSVHRGGSASYTVFAENDGEEDDRYAVDGCSDPSGLTVRFFRGSTDVTTAVRAGTYTTPLLGPFGFSSLTVKVHAQAGAALTTHGCAVTIASQHDPSTTDQVTLRIKVVS